MNILLTVAIPTFNRSKQLLNTLNNLAEQFKEIDSNSFEIIISDNCSTDNTSEIVSKWKQAHDSLRIFYNKNNSNLGYDGNCHKCIEISSGKYVWLMSDDDKLKKRGIKKVLKLLDTNTEFSFCFVNYDVSVNNVLTNSDCLSKNIEVLKSDQMMIKTNLAFSFVTSCIFNRDIWKSLDHINYYDTGWYNFYAARDCIIKGSNLLIGESLITQFGLDLKKRRKEKRISQIAGYEFYMGAHLKFLSFAFSLEDSGYSNFASNHAKKLSWNFNLRQIIYYKITQDSYNFSEINKIIFDMKKYFLFRPSFWLIHAPILLTPNFLISIFYKTLLPVYKKLKFN